MAFWVGLILGILVGGLITLLFVDYELKRWYDE